MPESKEKTLEELSERFMFVQTDYSHCSTKDKEAIEKLSKLCEAYTPRIKTFIDEIYTKENDIIFSGKHIKITHKPKQYILKIKDNTLSLDFNFEDFSTNIKDWGVFHHHIFNFLNNIAIHYLLEIQQKNIIELKVKVKELEKTDNKEIRLAQSLTNLAMMTDEGYIKKHKELLSKEEKIIKKIKAEYDKTKKLTTENRDKFILAKGNKKVLAARLAKFKKDPIINNHFSYTDIIVIAAITRLISDNNGNPIKLVKKQLAETLNLNKSKSGDFLHKISKSIEKLTTEKYETYTPVQLNGELAHIPNNDPIFIKKTISTLKKDRKTGIIKEATEVLIQFHNPVYRNNLQKFYVSIPYDFFEKLEKQIKEDKKLMSDVMTQVMIRVIQKKYYFEGKKYKTDAIDIMIRSKKQSVLNRTKDNFSRPDVRDTYIATIEYMLNFFIKMNMVKKIDIDKKDKKNKYPIIIEYPSTHKRLAEN